MIIIRFDSLNVVSVEPGKTGSHVYVTLTLNTGEVKRISKPLDGKSIHHYHQQSFRSSAWVSFYELSEVFYIPKHEKDEIAKKKRPAVKKSDDVVQINVKNGKKTAGAIAPEIDNSEEEINDLLSGIKW